MTDQELRAIERLYNRWAANSGSVNWGDLIMVVPALIAEVRRLEESTRLDAERDAKKGDDK